MTEQDKFIYKKQAAVYMDAAVNNIHALYELIQKKPIPLYELIPADWRIQLVIANGAMREIIRTLLGGEADNA